MANDKGIVSRALGLDRMAYDLSRAAKFGQGVEMTVGRIEAVDFEADGRARDRVQKFLHPLEVGRLFDRMDEALIPDAGEMRRFGHGRPPDVETLCLSHQRRGARNTRMCCAHPPRIDRTAQRFDRVM